ncbi:MAG TPA: ABC transporter ATP-binding protein, partial [Rugosimonospora sp.]|nr:ABC transporter ATP-binding protein [Rugosimonospora sp.]
LDVSIQAQIVTLLRDLQRSRGLTYLFISHDLGVVEAMSDRVAVMYAGRVVEVLRAADLHSAAAHPYTTALLEAMPVADPAVERERLRDARTPLPEATGPGGKVSAALGVTGCAYRFRCPLATAVCGERVPPLRPLAPDHDVACHHAEPV